MWQSEADSASAPCSPCRMDDSENSTPVLTNLIFCFSLSLSPMALCNSRLMRGGMRYSFSMSQGWLKSMYFLSSGSQK